ncbi:MAG: hypothetical protein VX044_00605 [Planctomycetota bacterium]|nr:hypothetical protein [Planctomycetota bacterium]
MTQSKTRSLNHLVLEGGVIMTSILLAFALDALWDSSKVAGKAQVALASLKAEFEANLVSCVKVRDYHFDNAREFAALLRERDDEILKLSDEEATTAYYTICSPRTFDALLGTTKSVISSGTFDILQDPRLRNGLDMFLNLVQDTHEDVQNMLYYMRVLGEHEVGLGGPWAHPGAPTSPGDLTPDTSYQRRITAGKLLQLLQSQDYIGRAKLYQGCASWYSGELGGIADHIRELLAIIKDLQN